LRHLEVFVVVLEIGRADPEDIRDQPAKASQSHGGEREHGRRVFQRLHPGQAQGVPLGVHRLLYLENPDEQNGGQAQQTNLFPVPAHAGDR